MKGITLTVMVDMGASKSIVDVAMWRKVAAPGSKMSGADATLQGANGQPLRVYGVVDQTFEL